MHTSFKACEQGQLKHVTARAVKQHYRTNENFSSWELPTTIAAVHRTALCFDRGIPLETGESPALI